MQATYAPKKSLSSCRSPRQRGQAFSQYISAAPPGSSRSTLTIATALPRPIVHPARCVWAQRPVPQVTCPHRDPAVRIDGPTPLGSPPSPPSVRVVHSLVDAPVPGGGGRKYACGQLLAAQEVPGALREVHGGPGGVLGGRGSQAGMVPALGNRVGVGPALRPLVRRWPPQRLLPVRGPPRALLAQEQGSDLLGRRTWGLPRPQLLHPLPRDQPLRLRLEAARHRQGGRCGA